MAGGVVALRIGASLLTFVEAHNLGWVGAGIAYQLSENTIQQPIISYVTGEHVPELERKSILAYAPALAVEVILPDDTAQKAHNRVLDYLASGTKLVWEVYLNSKTINAYSVHGLRIYQIDDLLDGGEVLPGFKLKVSEVFGK